MQECFELKSCRGKLDGASFGASFKGSYTMEVGFLSSISRYSLVVEHLPSHLEVVGAKGKTGFQLPVAALLFALFALVFSFLVSEFDNALPLF